MKRSVAILIFLAALLGGACNLKINMPTLGSLDRGSAVAAAGGDALR